MGTTVTGTLVDALGQPWANASVRFVFQPAPGVRGPYVWSGGPFHLEDAFRTDATGKFAYYVASNNEITPIGSKWQVIVGPNATYPAFVFDLYLTTGTLDISALFASKIAINTVQSQFVPRAYRDSEVITPPNSGQIYYDAQAKTMKYWENGVWNPFGSSSGGGMVYPPAGIAVSTGSSWAASLDPSLLVTYPTPGLALSSGTGWLVSIDPNTLQRNITLTTNGNAGPATFAGNVLNIPQYQGAGGGMVYPAAGIAVSDGTQWLPSLHYSVNANGSFTADGGGVNLAWNVAVGSGETDFINSKGGGVGGFTWYNVAGGAVLNASTPYSMKLDPNNALHVPILLAENYASVANTLDVGGGFLRLGARTGTTAPWDTGSPNINSDNSNLFINAAGNGAVHFNWDQGTRGVKFGNGAGQAVINFNSQGAGSFNGAVGSGGGFIATAYTNGPTAAGSFGYTNETTYLDSAGSSGTRGNIRLRVMSAGAANILDGIGIDSNGTTSIYGNSYTGGFGAFGNSSVFIGSRPSQSWIIGSANINADNTNLVINGLNVPGSAIYFNFDQGPNGVRFGNGYSVVVAYIDGSGNAQFNGNAQVNGSINANGTIQGTQIITGAFQGGGVNVAGIAKFWTDGGSSFIDGGPNGRLLINNLYGEGSYTMVMGVLDAVTRLNTNSFTIGNTGINGYVLMGNGSSYVPQPLPATSVASDIHVVTGSRAMNVDYTNPYGKTMIVTGYANTLGGTGSVECFIGAPGSGGAGVSVWGNQVTASLNGGAAGFYMTVPSGWYYRVSNNTLSQGPGGGNCVTTINRWIETTIG